ncbi:MAG: SDR family NAD(P)-dependent oxidoreductase [Nocardioidaceae bacterium]|nr:SDR family NAD(P)-dependent oxidoreductase [Nocardioidaceae bacterium]
MTQRRTAVVTGASSGIGAATARRLGAEGFAVVCAARRRERIEPLAAEIGGTAVDCDVTDPASVARLAHEVGTEVAVLVNNAGGAFGLDTVAETDPAQWQQMFELNVLGTLRVTQALLPALVASGDGLLVNVGSTAGHEAYVKGGGYTVTKAGVAVLTETLRQELLGQPVRVTEIVPGMVRTEEFSVNRLGDADAAAKIYAGVDRPLSADDVADCIAWVATRPWHVNIDQLFVKPRAQASQYQVHRTT